ncbi:MAG: DNA primase catalytic subunit PriS [Methanomassiliicoccales archaeon]
MSGETEFILGWFRRYYGENPPRPPSRFGKREFGFMFLDRGYVQRHLAFSRASDLREFFVNRVPAHAYHSSAYYQDPGASTMAEKGWLGADLIFDLDADHVPGAEGLSYPQMLARVKEEAVHLIDDFLLGDLGFDASHLRIVFSGGRGYHVHVNREDVIDLGSHERREIVDYITGTDLDMGWVFPERASFEKRIKDLRKVHRSVLVPGKEAGGWRGKMRRGLETLLEELEGSQVDEVRGRYGSASEASEALVRGLLKDLFSPRGGRRVKDLILDKGNLEDLSDRRYRALLIRMVEEEIKPRLVGEVDEPVTSDVKRLIRLPGSLHGKTGMVVRPLEREEMDHFEPLRDAVPGMLTDDPVEVEVHDRVDMEIAGERLSLSGREEVPTRAALFLLCRGMASLAGHQYLA